MIGSVDVTCNPPSKKTDKGETHIFISQNISANLGCFIMLCVKKGG